MSQPTPIRYRVDLHDRRQHLLQVTVTVPADLAAGARLVLPTWTPGSYVIRDYVHHVQQRWAVDATGARIPLDADGHTAWRLPEDASGPVEATFELYANQLTVRTNHVDDHHALIVSPATFPYVDGGRDRRHLVTVPVAAGTQVHALLPAGEEPDTYVADDYDHLVDSAFEAGALPSVDYDVAGVPHRFVYAGHGGHPDLDRLAEDARAIGESAADLFGGRPASDAYTFLCEGWDASGGGGGLEHRDGAVLMAPVHAFTDPDHYGRFLGLLAHEYLHQWNVKRLVPRELTALDYVTPTHTTSLWVAEGWTAYYDKLLPLRAGVWTVDTFLERQREQLDGVLDSPATTLQSVAESSHDAWVKLYVRDENSVNATVSYYGHGAVLAWCLDLLIRQQDPAGPGLDGALRALWDGFGDGRGYTPDDVVAAVSDAAGTDLRDFFDDYVTRPAVPPITDLVSVVGLEVGQRTNGPVPPTLGMQTNEDDEGVTITAVLRDGPAWQAGVTGGDRLLAIDRVRVGRGELTAALSGYAAGDTVELAVFRGPRLLTMPVVLGDPRPPRRLLPVEDPSEDQRAAFHAWTGHDLGALSR